MTFKDYALRDYDETPGILESDWYNAQVELLRLSSETWGSGLIQIEEGDFSLMRWYAYTLTLEPGQTLKNAVTAPLYPAIDAGYTPSLYAYTYLLSPAKTWAQFGELEVVVKTPYYMTESGIDGFTKTDGGYALTLPGLPEGELTFTLSESEKPQPPEVVELVHYADSVYHCSGGSACRRWRSRISAKPQEEKNKKIERKVHHDETKGFRDMGGRSFCFGRNCSILNL